MAAAEAKAIADKAAAELKAKQEVEANAAAELRAKQAADKVAEIAALASKVTEIQAKLAPIKKTTITCVKGKLSKKVTAVKPKCPSGYKLKK
jgi:hypothetical protein